MEDAHRRISDTSALLSMNHTTAVLSVLKQFHEKGEYWDVQILVGTKLFKCQRSILAANSEYFDTLFRSGDFRHSDVTANQIITWPRKDYATAFEIILLFMYTGEFCVKDSNTLSVLVLSDFLSLRTDLFKERMIEQVRDRSKESKPMSFAIDLFCYTCDRGENILLDITIAHVCRHLYHFSEHPQLNEISFEHLNALLQRSYNYIVPLPGSSDVLVKVVHNWVNYNREIRSQYRLQLMKNIDFANVSSELTLWLMNTTEMVVDEFSNLNIEVGLQKTALWGTMSLNVQHVSELTGKGAIMLFSSFCMISNLLWRISFERGTISDHSSDDVGVFLCCNGTNLASEWNCYAKAIFSIESHKEGVEDFSGDIGPSFFSSLNPVPHAWGLPSFVPWSDLIDPERGYIADDDSIALKAYVHADVPFLPYDPQ